ncbi:LacI family transcriptional regulator [Alkalihalobacillus oceani]|uniref:Catabolite control protein A n=1 Tax=Halalkalibacter oceani TaxID=1653776 RepID=A0A9X2IMP5_9BACI|nr:LacI family DNA-binding transcriptional regulator [Halalkalibacter oceani]MCM3712971.1 LacI family transcriptional regulator [Halalkalibacter oceani]
MATIYDIAKKANVSAMTVSRVINNSGSIKESTRKKVEEAIKELNYIPNSAARSLVSKKSNLLALLITDVTNPFFTKVARGAEDKAQQMGYQLMLCNTDESVEKESKYIDVLLAAGVDGVLFTPSGEKSKKNLRKLAKHGIPFTLIDRKVQGINCDVVLGDNHEGTRQLLQHLIDLGHEKIAIINAPLDISTAHDRYQAYVNTLKMNGLSVDERLVLKSHYKKENATNNIEYILSLSKKERPTAIFATNNFIAVETIRALREKKLEVPHDMAFVCFDDLDHHATIDPFLTVASQPAYDFGFTGVQFVIERVEGTAPQEFRKIQFQTELVVRKSSGGQL